MPCQKDAKRLVRSEPRAAILGCHEGGHGLLDPHVMLQHQR
jgi:hypothetical protein